MKTLLLSSLALVLLKNNAIKKILLAVSLVLILLVGCSGFKPMADAVEHKALVPKPLPANDVTQNPFLSPGDSVIHNDCYGSDVTNAVLPLGINSTLTRANDHYNAASCPSSALYDRYGNAITQLNGGLCIADLDTDGIPRSGRYCPRMGDDPDFLQGYILQTSYSMVDSENNIIAPTSHGHIVFLRTHSSDGKLLVTFEKVLDVDIASAALDVLREEEEKLDTRLLSVIYDYDGNLWFVTGGFLVDPVRSAKEYGSGFLGYLSRAYIEKVLNGEKPESLANYLYFKKLAPGEGAENGISSSEKGTVILTNMACYMLNAEISGGVRVKWATSYESDGWKEPIGAPYEGTGLAWGGGSTPTLTHDLVLFTDNRKTVNLIALDADTGKKVAETPVLDKLGEDVPVSVENSILVYSHSPDRASVVICNWYGAGNAGLATGDSSVQTWDNIYDAKWMAEGNSHIAPGVTRVDIVRQANGSYRTETKWLRKDIRETAMMKLSTATGYLYGYWQYTGDSMWRYDILDFDTGKTVYSYEVSTDPRYNNMAVGMIPSPNGNGLYVPTNTKGNLKELICLRDSFAHFPEDVGVPLSPASLERKYLNPSDFQRMSGTKLPPASYLLRAKFPSVTEKTVLTFLINGVEGDASDFVLYCERDGRLTPIGADSWRFRENGPLRAEQLYSLELTVDAGAESAAVILAKKLVKQNSGGCGN